MRVITVFVCKMLGLIALEYVALVAVAVLAWPLPDDRTAGFFQSSDAPNTLFRTEPKYVVYGRKALEQDRSMIVVLGSSNAAGAIHLERFRDRLPDRYVANVALPGSNVTQIAQAHDLIAEITPPEARRNITYVIGIWYGIFGTDAARWHGNPTDIEIELARYGLYRKVGSEWVPLLSAHRMDLVTTLIRPLLGLDKLIKGRLHPLRVWFEKGEIATSGRVLTADEKAGYIRFWKSYLNSEQGRLEDEQFETLERLVRILTAEGSRVVLVDMPIPEWHEQLSPFQADYVAKIVPLVDRLQSEGIKYVRIDGHYRDVDFIDEVHPVRAIGDQWTAQIVQALQPPPPSE
jgi:hypothetical protein